MKHRVLVLCAAAPIFLFASPATAATRHYDCSKAGNANKAACKTSPAQPATASTTKVTTTTTTRHYDCTKPGNANKAECKAASARAPSGAAAGATKTTTTTTAATTNCTFVNRMRGTCATGKAATTTSTTVAPAPRPKTAAASSENSNPAGAIAKCKDGLYSHAAHRQGACARHGGVTQWM